MSKEVVLGNVMVDCDDEIRLHLTRRDILSVCVEVNLIPSN